MLEDMNGLQRQFSPLLAKLFYNLTLEADFYASEEDGRCNELAEKRVTFSPFIVTTSKKWNSLKKIIISLNPVKKEGSRFSKVLGLVNFVL